MTIPFVTNARCTCGNPNCIGVHTVPPTNPSIGLKQASALTANANAILANPNCTEEEKAMASKMLADASAITSAVLLGQWKAK